MEYTLAPYIMSDLGQPNYQGLTKPMDNQNSLLYNPYMASLSPTNFDDTTNVIMPNLNFGPPFPMVELNQSQNLQIYQPSDQGMSFQNKIIPSNQYIPNIPSTTLPNLKISNPYLMDYGIDMFTNNMNVV
jgi:hypothetical protein